MATGSGIEVVGLQQFRRDLKLAQTGLTRELSSALKKAGAPPLGRVKVLAGRTSRSPRSTGLLQKSYKVSVRGTAAYLKSSVPYAAGAEWGVYGKWAGFRLRISGTGARRSRSVRVARRARRARGDRGGSRS